MLQNKRVRISPTVSFEIVRKASAHGKCFSLQNILELLLKQKANMAGTNFLITNSYSNSCWRANEQIVAILIFSWQISERGEGRGLNGLREERSTVRERYLGSTVSILTKFIESANRSVCASAMELQPTKGLRYLETSNRVLSFQGPR